MRLKKGKAKRKDYNRKEVAWTLDQFINSNYLKLYFRNIKATN